MPKPPREIDLHTFAPANEAVAAARVLSPVPEEVAVEALHLLQDVGGAGG